MSDQVDVIVDEIPRTGRFNMAMDAVLLDLAAEREVSVLRLYRWSEATVTLGHFQAARQESISDEIPEGLRGLPVVRRLSGGGAILHDQEITYACVLPATHPVRNDASRLYEVIHRAVISLLAECGVPAMLRSEFDAQRTTGNSDAGGHSRKSNSSEPFLCFLRSNPNDIVHASGAKIVGSAQRRRKGIILQHGSILIRESPAARGIFGIHELSPEFDESRFLSQLPQTLGDVIGRDLRFRNYLAEELEPAACD